MLHCNTNQINYRLSVGLSRGIVSLFINVHQLCIHCGCKYKSIMHFEHYMHSHKTSVWTVTGFQILTILLHNHPNKSLKWYVDLWKATMYITFNRVGMHKIFKTFSCLWTIYIYLVYVFIMAKYSTTHVQNSVKTSLSVLRLSNRGILALHDSNVDLVHVATIHAYASLHTSS